MLPTESVTHFSIRAGIFHGQVVHIRGVLHKGLRLRRS
jgi:hypothetical protein